MKKLLVLILSIPSFSFAQVGGKVIDGSTKENLPGARVHTPIAQTMTNEEGEFNLEVPDSAYPLQIITRYTDFKNDTTIISGPTKDLIIRLFEPSKVIETLVVTAGRRPQRVEEVPISMEIIRPELMDNKGYTNLEQAIGQTPGVYAMDGQISIRGGTGFSYGAGSRTMVLWNGMPMVSGDAGDVKFNTIPIESAQQVEVIKGASSVLYGSGALNGIISLQEREPTRTPVTRVKYQVGIFGNPKRESLRWWQAPPTFHLVDFYHSRRINRFGYSIAAQGMTSDGYRQGNTEDRVRLNGTFSYYLDKQENLQVGVGYNIQLQNNGNFLIWQSAEQGYTPSGGGDPSVPGSTLSQMKGNRVNIDPYIKYRDKKGNRHALKSRWYHIENQNPYNETQNAKNDVGFVDYQFQHKTNFGMTLTTGATSTITKVYSKLYGNHSSFNGAGYLQLEQKLFERLTLLGGMRIEYFQQDGKRGDSDFYFNKAQKGTKLPVYPIFRVAANYQAAKATFLRASYGQGVRYPAVSERYTTTSVGALNIFPNQNLIPEKGWAAEIGLKQIIPIGKNWKGLLDVAGFINRYDNMLEFTFGIHNPPGTTLSLNPNDPYFLPKWVGFKAMNTESARILGAEISFSSQGKIGEVELATMMGYCYMDPRSLNTDEAYINSLSSYKNENGVVTYDNTLKYRFNHLVRADIEATWMKISLGVSVRYNSKITNIDKVFEEAIAGTEILPGLKEYRMNYDMKGAIVWDLRLGYNIGKSYRVGFIVNNLLNREYTTRPGDIQAPRTFILQVQAKF